MRELITDNYSDISDNRHSDAYIQIINKRRSKAIRRRRQLHRLYIKMTCVFAFILICTASVVSFNSYAGGKELTSSKYYKSICVEKGDTLYSIAKENISSEYKNIDQYINEVKHMNHLTSDNIHTGCYIIIPYYE